MVIRSGRHFLQIPGPTNVPDRVLHAIAQPTIDHRGPAFADLAKAVLADLQWVFKTSDPVIVYPASGTGAWEAALVNTCSPGDRLLAFETGHFASLWAQMATDLGLEVDLVPGDWRTGVDPEVVEAKLAADEGGYRAVAVVHNETSTGVRSRVPDIRDAIDRAEHPALLLVDTISSLGSMDYRHEEWGVDVSIGGSQKGLMLPPGLSFNAVSRKALDASGSAGLPRSYWDWQAMLAANADGYFPYTPGTNLLYGLREAIAMLRAEGLENVYARHDRHAEATRRAVAHWGLEVLPANPEEYSNTLTAVVMPPGYDANHLREVVLDRFDMALGTGLAKLAGDVFRIGHLGDFNDLMLLGTLGGVEAGLGSAGVPFNPGGVVAATDYLRDSSS